MVTYIFGAGASYKTLPLATELRSELNQFADYLDKQIIEMYDARLKFKVEDGIFSYRTITKEFVTKIKLLVAEAGRHQTLDTYAKRLFLTKAMDSYNDLKNVLTCYFMFKQLTQNPHDRYDHFLASILTNNDDKIKFSDRIKIFSWNYDFQLEMAMKYYLDNLHYIQIAQFLKLAPNISYIPYEPYGVVKINGSALAYNSEKSVFICPDFQNDYETESEIISDIMKIFVMLNYYPKLYSSGIQFAWENDIFVKDVIGNSHIMKWLNETSTLVVVGYSFPFFNREIDRQIITNMINLSAVYIQAPADQADSLLSKFQSVIDRHPNSGFIEKNKVTDIGQFFLPPEL